MFKARRVSSSRWLPIISCLILLVMGLSACAQDQTTTTSSGPLPIANPNNPITIGISLPLTPGKENDFSSDGQLMKQGYELWADYINNNGGLLGRPVKLVIRDDQGTESVVQSDYTQLMKQKVDLLFGPFSTLLTNAAEQTPGIFNYPFVEGAGGAPSVFTDPNTNKSPRWPNIFAVSVPVGNNLDSFVDYILSLPLSQRPKTVAYLSSDDPFTFPQVVRAQGLLSQAGIRTVFPTPANFPQYKQMPASQYGLQYEYSDNDKNFADEAAKAAQEVVNAKPDVVVLGTLLPDIQAEIAVFKQKHFHPEAIVATAGPDLGTAFVNAIGGMKYTEGMFVPNGWYPQANNYQNAQMVQAYVAKYGGTVDGVNSDVAEAYSVGQVTQQAVEKVGSLDKNAIMAALRTGTFNSVQGAVKFAPDGENTLGLAYLFQWQAGTLIPVYPLSIASENPEYGGYNF